MCNIILALTIEVVTISHPDADHYNYVPSVIPIATLSALKRVYISCTKDRYRGDESTTRGWLSAAEDSGKLTIGDGDAECRPCYRNSNSLVLCLEYG